MSTRNPTPAQVRDALSDHGVPVRLYKGWDTIGRAWNANGGGLDATVSHHTATASATGSSGAPSLEWCATAYSKPAANMLVGRGRNDVWLLSAGSCFHPGNGGPWPALGLGVGNVLHYRAFGIELDDPGRSIGSLTDWQIECNARILAAIQDLTGNGESMHITHTCWTNGCHGVNPAGGSPYYGRKDDTLGDSGGKTGPYSATFWRSESKKYLGGNVPPVPGEDDDMPIILKKGASVYRLLSGNEMAGISQASVDNLVKAGVKVVGIANEDWPSLEAVFGANTGG